MVKDNVYVLTTDTRIRKEQEKYILINIATQGLHFISPTAYTLVSRMDGKLTVGEIISAEFPDASKDDEGAIYDFVNKLEERRLIRKIEEKSGEL